MAMEWSSALSHSQPRGHSVVILLWVLEGTVRDIPPLAVGVTLLNPLL